MSNTPAELVGFPFEIMEKIRTGDLSGHNNTNRSSWMERLSAWLFTLTELDTEAYKQFKLLGIDKKRKFKVVYGRERKAGASVSGAKMEAETDDSVLEAEKLEVLAEVKSKYVHQIAKDTVENINVIKAAMKHESREGPFSGQQPA